MNTTTFAHLRPEDRIQVTASSHDGTPVVRLGGELSLLFASNAQLSALREAITDYLANRFAIAPAEVAA